MCRMTSPPTWFPGDQLLPSGYWPPSRTRAICWGWNVGPDCSFHGQMGLLPVGMRGEAEIKELFRSRLVGGKWCQGQGGNAQVRNGTVFLGCFDVTQPWRTLMPVRAFWGFFESCFNINFNEIKDFQVFTWTKRKRFQSFWEILMQRNRKVILIWYLSAIEQNT